MYASTGRIIPAVADFLRTDNGRRRQGNARVLGVECKRSARVLEVECQGNVRVVLGQYSGSARVAPGQ